ncbi:3'-5' exonuclease [Pontivivens ytuae]|uniref:DNA-directed DNA polymerase n=1 Tax=Pontivivens ytuae TaxID=2789856 RepID=A0A7S9LRX2_9RHOB|nr:3'-5' exonuclease [Pontivivens ytuae]QPH54179.1 3'-5' exonuclease [Pontivivens ytuae]
MGPRRRFLALLTGFALALCALFAVALWLGWRQAGGPVAPFLSAGLIGGFAALLLTAGLWLFLDEQVVRPALRIAAAFRARAHGETKGALPPAPHLGDLVPAATALCDSLDAARADMTARLAEETALVEAERAQLAALLSEIPIAVMTVNAAHQITLYDRQCVHMLGHVAPLGLDRSVFDYVEETALRTALGELDAAAGRNFIDVELPTADGSGLVSTRLRPIGRNQGYMLAMEVENAVVAERPLVFDFGLIDRTPGAELADRPLSHLSFVVFDSETTGLDPAKDAVVQLAGVRVVNGRVVEGEVFDHLVDPGRPIPPVAIRVHGVTNEMVAGAPPLAKIGHDFHEFARGAVLVAHNAPFDLAFLKREETRIGKCFDHPVLDTVLLSAALFGESEEHTLDAIAERLDVAIPGADRHTALGDARATAEVLVKMIPMAEGMGIRTFGEAVEVMRRFTRLLPDLNQA